MNDTMEHRANASASWVAVQHGQASAPVDLHPTAVSAWQVRTRGTETQFASAVLNVSIPRRLAAPNATFNVASNAITGVSTAMEFSVDGGQTWTRVAATTIPRIILGNDAVVVHVRIAATAGNAASAVRIVQVP